MPARDERRDAVEVRREHPGGLDPVHHQHHALQGAGGGQRRQMQAQPVLEPHPRHRQHPRPGADRVGDPRLEGIRDGRRRRVPGRGPGLVPRPQRHLAKRHPAGFQRLPGPRVGRELAQRCQDLVAGLEREPVGDQRQPGRGALGQRDVAGIDAQQPRRLRPNPVRQAQHVAPEVHVPRDGPPDPARAAPPRWTPEAPGLPSNASPTAGRAAGRSGRGAGEGPRGPGARSGAATWATASAVSERRDHRTPIVPALSRGARPGTVQKAVISPAPGPSRTPAPPRRGRPGSPTSTPSGPCPRRR